MKRVKNAKKACKMCGGKKFKTTLNEYDLEVGYNPPPVKEVSVCKKCGNKQ